MSFCVSFVRTDGSLGRLNVQDRLMNEDKTAVSDRWTFLRLLFTVYKRISLQFKSKKLKDSPFSFVFTATRHFISLSLLCSFVKGVHSVC